MEIKLVLWVGRCQEFQQEKRPDQAMKSIGLDKELCKRAGLKSEGARGVKVWW